MKKFRVLVKPGKQEQNVQMQKDYLEKDVYVVDVKAQPQDGAANSEVIDVLSEHLNVSKSDLQIKSGHTSRIKILALSY